MTNHLNSIAEDAFERMIAELRNIPSSPDFSINPDPTDFAVAALHVDRIGKIIVDYFSWVIAEAASNFPGTSLSGKTNIAQLQDAIDDLVGALTTDAWRVAETTPRNRGL